MAGNRVFDLLGTSICWLLLDFAFCGLGTKILESLLKSGVRLSRNLRYQYEVIRLDSIRSIITISTGSLLGSIVLIKVIDHVHRKSWLVWSFVGTTVLFASVGGSNLWAASSSHLTMTLYIPCQLLFNLDPNTLTFIIVGLNRSHRLRCDGQRESGSVTLSGGFPPR